MPNQEENGPHGLVSIHDHDLKNRDADHESRLDELAELRYRASCLSSEATSRKRSHETCGLLLRIEQTNTRRSYRNIVWVADPVNRPAR